MKPKPMRWASREGKKGEWSEAWRPKTIARTAGRPEIATDFGSGWEDNRERGMMDRADGDVSEKSDGASV